MPRTRLRFSRLISVYLCTEYLRFFLLSLILFLGLSLLVDFFDRLDNFIKYGASVSATVRYFLFKMPLFVTQAAPAAALTGVLLGCGLLSRNRELLALKACGIGSWQMALPVLITASFLSLAVSAWNEWIVPAAFHTSRYINTVEVKKRPFKGLFHERGFWYHGEHAFYHIDHFDSQKKILSGLTMYTLDEHFRVRTLVEISQAVWKNEEWHFTRIQEKSLEQPLTENGQRPVRSLKAGLSETPEDFSLIDMKAEEFSSKQLRRYIQSLQKKGLDTSEYLVDLHLKGAVPFAYLCCDIAWDCSDYSRCQTIITTNCSRVRPRRRIWLLASFSTQHLIRSQWGIISHLSSLARQRRNQPLWHILAAGD